MMRILFVLLAIAVTAPTTQPTSLKADLVFLTREGCVNTPDMLANLDDALSTLKLPHDYRVLNIGALRRERCSDGLSHADAALEGQRRVRDAEVDAALSRTDLKAVSGRSSVPRQDRSRVESRLRRVTK